MIYDKIRASIIYLEKRNNTSYFYTSIFRIITVLISRLNLKRKKDFIKCGNYLLPKLPKAIPLTIISAGIGVDITFEKALHNSYKIKKIVLVDPTEISNKYVKENLHYNHIFINKCLGLSDKKQKLYFPPDTKNNFNYSLDNTFNKKKYFETDVISLTTIIKNYKINNIDILKLDIEGYEDKVINQILDRNIHPNIILFELTKNFSIFRQFEYYSRLLRVIKNLKSKNYHVYDITQLKFGYRLDMIAIKQ